MFAVGKRKTSITSINLDKINNFNLYGFNLALKRVFPPTRVILCYEYQWHIFRYAWQSGASDLRIFKFGDRMFFSFSTLNTQNRTIPWKNVHDLKKKIPFAITLGILQIIMNKYKIILQSSRFKIYSTFLLNLIWLVVIHLYLICTPCTVI